MKLRIATVAVLLMLGALLVFLCPLPAGPFTATNGPATAFRAAAAILHLFLLLCHVARHAPLALRRCFVPEAGPFALCRYFASPPPPLRC